MSVICPGSRRPSVTHEMPFLNGDPEPDTIGQITICPECRKWVLMDWFEPHPYGGRKWRIVEHYGRAHAGTAAS